MVKIWRLILGWFGAAIVSFAGGFLVFEGSELYTGEDSARENLERAVHNTIRSIANERIDQQPASKTVNPESKSDALLEYFLLVESGKLSPIGRNRVSQAFSDLLPVVRREEHKGMIFMVLGGSLCVAGAAAAIILLVWTLKISFKTSL